MDDPQEIGDLPSHKEPSEPQPPEGERFRKRYRGNYIAILAGSIVASAPTLEAIVEIVKDKGLGMREVLIEYVPPEGDVIDS